MGTEFRRFLLRGNVVELGVGFVIGASFAAVVKAFTESLLTPLIAALVGTPNFSAWQFTVRGSVFTVGLFLNALLSFILVAAVVFFFVVRPMNALVARSHREPTPDPTTRKCPECLSEIPLDARRCAHCTSVVAA